LDFPVLAFALYVRGEKMGSFTQNGYLVIAHISGYTSFVAKTELEHSHEIPTAKPAGKQHSAEAGMA
jgi:hypothetical protein